ncbi:uncharacterized protein LOC125236122 [Leguminivora glycinivorella]|uniref:uncharacterized protein LOC125236122 n=1 Tax=Leguminivora glycinivorella TaxID=1035111 RepID=UPI00200CB411|nr:uncharacterized protein LOC125236122 [Leguminivora glycinivorella]
MDEEMLIALVKEYGELYDSEHKQYEDQHKREASWQEIATRMNQPAQDCRDRWKRLRDNYRKARLLRQRKKAQGYKKLKPIKYEHLFSFIDGVIDSREKPDLTEPGDEDSESSSSNNIQETYLEVENTVPEFERNNGERTTGNDILVKFFSNLGETVSTFPPQVQIRVKRDIFKIINDAEEEVLSKRYKVREVRRESNAGIVNVKFEASDSNFI